jgi:hypothetical protein
MRGTILVSATFVALFAAAPANAQEPPSLTGENLHYSESSVPFQFTEAQCDQTTEQTTFAYTIPDPDPESPVAPATATGPYPGTFTESGNVTIGPQINPPIPPEIGGFDPGTRGFSVGFLIELEASFTIDSEVGQVEGTKHLIVEAPGNTGVCTEFDSIFGLPAQGILRDARATLSYEATITTSTGKFRDRGTSELFLQELDLEFLPPFEGTASFGEFDETFVSEELVPITSTPGATTGGGQVLHMNMIGTTFGFTFQSDGVNLKGECLVQDHAPANNTVNCLDVLLYFQTGNEATIYGNATVNGDDAGIYRLHVVDNGESGIGQDFFEFETESGYVRSGFLTEGDIQVHTG